MRAIVLAVLLVLPGAASADCLSVRGYDRRQACLAEQRQSPEGCTSIRNPDHREICRQRPVNAMSSAWAAQFLAAAELVRRGYTVSFTMGNITPVADLMVGTPEGKQFWVDVKGLASRTDWLVKPKAPHASLFYILVALSPLVEPGSSREPDQFYVLTQDEANQLEREYREARPGRKTTMPGFKFNAPRDHRDRWDKLPADDSK
jgi:hypothetical protein